MAAVGDIYQTVLKAVYLGQQVYNVFHYVCDTIGTGAGGADNANSWTDGNIIGFLIPLTSTLITYEELYTVNLNDLDDFHLYDVNDTGALSTSSANAISSWTALKYRYNRIATTGRNGYKRFAGIPEVSVSGNLFAGSTEDAEALAARLVLETDDDPEYNGWVFKPFIASRPIVYGTNPGGYIPTVALFDGITTQVSRKP